MENQKKKITDTPADSKDSWDIKERNSAVASVTLNKEEACWPGAWRNNYNQQTVSTR